MRSLTAPALAVLAGPVVPMALLVDMAFSPPVAMASSGFSLQVGPTLYHGAGLLGSVDAIKDSPADSQTLRFSLSGTSSDAIGMALAEDARGRAVLVRLAILDPDTHAVLDTPTVWAGNIDQMPVSLGSGTASIGVTAQHRGATFRRAKPLSYTDGDQQRISAGDTSLRYLLSQAQHQDVWPAAAFFRQ